MGKPLTVYQIKQTIQERGYAPLSEEVVIAPDSPMPKVFCLKAENDEVMAFKIDAWRAI